MQLRSPNTVREEPGDITKCSDSTDEGNLGSFNVAGQLSVSLRLRPRRVFPVVHDTYALIMNVSKALVSRELLS